MAVDREKRYVDPMFFIPEGIPPEVWDYKGDDQIGSDDDFTDIFSDDDSEDDDGLGVVDSLTVISQKIRRVGKTNHKVVDIVVEIEDVPGADKYEFRVVKV